VTVPNGEVVGAADPNGEGAGAPIKNGEFDEAAAPKGEFDPNWEFDVAAVPNGEFDFAAVGANGGPGGTFPSGVMSEFVPNDGAFEVEVPNGDGAVEDFEGPNGEGWVDGANGFLKEAAPTVLETDVPLPAAT
jgi:hypothetical protein